MWVISITVLNDYDTSLTFTSVLVAQLCLTFCNAWTLTHQAPLSMEFSSKNTGVVCRFLLQGIFPTQGLNPATHSSILAWESLWARKDSDTTE